MFAAATDLDWHPPDTGSLHGDLTELNREIQDSLTEEPSIALALIAVSFRSKDAARALRQLWEDRYTQCEIVAERAIERGEIPAGTDPRALLVAATAPVYHRLVLLRAPADAGFPERAAGAAVSAARAGAFESPVAEADTVETSSG
ncbi:TetR-like C-terminal domain-containing protein [Nocardia paucivorans]|uniref:TetR-like C-terminal domain-containing protein n=1 Tax=Nocardia paucivorans TaxID=114259 RepID=UPI00031EE273|nr:TetR-like C-terminal domain-containing protein [Nocardia paucivorans]